MIFLIFLVFVLLGCSSECVDCGGHVDYQIQGFKNESGVEVRIQLMLDSVVEIDIAQGATFTFSEVSYNIPNYDCGLYLSGCDSKPIDVLLKFNTAPPKCLNFFGEIIDSLVDIRSIKSYHQLESGVSLSGAHLVPMEYVISLNLLNQAVECKDLPMAIFQHAPAFGGITSRGTFIKMTCGTFGRTATRLCGIATGLVPGIAKSASTGVTAKAPAFTFATKNPAN